MFTYYDIGRATADLLTCIAGFAGIYAGYRVFQNLFAKSRLPYRLCQAVGFLTFLGIFGVGALVRHLLVST